MKPTDFKLSKMDRYMIKQMFMKMWEEKAEIGPEAWFDIIMRFIEWKGYRLEENDEVYKSNKEQK